MAKQTSTNAFPHYTGTIKRLFYFKTVTNHLVWKVFKSNNFECTMLCALNALKIITENQNCRKKEKKAKTCHVAVENNLLFRTG